MKAALLAILAVMVIGVAVIVLSGIGFYNTAVSQEASLNAQYKQNQNKFAEFTNTALEVAQVPRMYAKDLKDVYMGAISGRYGKDGSRAVFQFIKEHNPTFDSSMYAKIQQVVEAGRASFSNEQKSLLDKKRVYEQYLNTFPNVVWAGFLGFPKIDLTKIDIVTSEATEKAFETKKAGPLNLSGDAPPVAAE